MRDGRSKTEGIAYKPVARSRSYESHGLTNAPWGQQSPSRRSGGGLPFGQRVCVAMQQFPAAVLPSKDLRDSQDSPGRVLLIANARPFLSLNGHCETEISTGPDVHVFDRQCRYASSRCEASSFHRDGSPLMKRDCASSHCGRNAWRAFPVAGGLGAVWPQPATANPKNTLRRNLFIVHVILFRRNRSGTAEGRTLHARPRGARGTAKVRNDSLS